MWPSYFQYFTITVISLSIVYGIQIVTEGPPGEENINYITTTPFTTLQTDEESSPSSDYENYETTTSNTEETIKLPPVFDVTQYVQNCPPGSAGLFSCEEDAVLWVEYGESIQKLSDKLCHGFQVVINKIMHYSCSLSPLFAEDAFVLSTRYMEDYNVKFPDNITNQQIEKRKGEYIKSFDKIRKMEQALNLSEELREIYIKTAYQARLVKFLEDYKEKMASNRNEIDFNIQREEKLLEEYKELCGPLGENLAKYLEQNNLENVFNFGKLLLILNSSVYMTNNIEPHPIQHFIISDTNMRISIQQKIKMLNIEDAITLPPVFDVTQYENNCIPNESRYASPFSCEEDEVLWIKYGVRIQRMSEKLCDDFQVLIILLMYFSCSLSPLEAEVALELSTSYMEHYNETFPENITNPQLEKRKQEYIKSFDTVRNMEQVLNLSQELREAYLKVVYQARMVEFLEGYKEKIASNRSEVNFDIEKEENLLKKYQEYFGSLVKNLTKYLEQNNLENVFNSGKLALILNSSLYINTPQEFIIEDNKMRILILQNIQTLISGESIITFPPVFDVTQYKNDCPSEMFSFHFSCEKDEILWIEYGETIQEMSKRLCLVFQTVILYMTRYSCSPSLSYADNALAYSAAYMSNYNMVEFPENVTNPQLEERKEEYIKSADTIRNMERALNLSEQMRLGYTNLIYQTLMVESLKQYKEKKGSNISETYFEQAENLLNKYKESFGPLGENLAKYLVQKNLENVFNLGKLALILNSSLYINTSQEFIIENNKMRSSIEQTIRTLISNETITFPPVFDVTQYKNDCPPEGVSSPFSCEKDEIQWIEYGESIQKKSKKLCENFQQVVNQIMYYSCSLSPSEAEDALYTTRYYMEDYNMKFPENIANLQLEKRKEEYIKSFDTIRNMERALNISEQMREGYIKMIYQARMVEFLNEYKEKSASDRSEINNQIEQEVNVLKKYKENFSQLGKYLVKFLEQNDLENVFNSGKLAIILNSSLYNTNPIQQFIIEDNNMIIAIHQKIQMLTLYVSPILVVILLTVGLTGNILLLLIFIKHKEMRTVANLMIVVLAITDCISLLLNLPTQYYWGTSSWHDEWGCRTFQFSRKFAISVSTYSIVMISFQRYVAVKIFPKSGGGTIGKKTKTTLQFISVWIFGFLYNIPRLSDSSIVNHKCTDVSLRILPIIVTSDFLFICVLPSVSIILLSVFTASNIKISVSNVLWETTGLQELKKGRMLSVHVLTGLAVLFVISYFPYFVFQFITVTCGFYPNYYTFATIHTWTYGMLFTNSCLNPVALGIMSKKYRKHYIELIGYFKCISLKIIKLKASQRELLLWLQQNRLCKPCFFS